MANECPDSPNGKHDWDYLGIEGRGAKNFQVFICRWCGREKTVEI